MKFDKYHDVAQPFREGERKKVARRLCGSLSKNRVLLEKYISQPGSGRGSVNVIAVECS